MECFTKNYGKEISKFLKNVLVTIQKSAKKTFNNCALVPSNARKQKTPIYFTNS